MAMLRVWMMKELLCEDAAEGYIYEVVVVVHGEEVFALTLLFCSLTAVDGYFVVIVVVVERSSRSL